MSGYDRGAFPTKDTLKRNSAAKTGWLRIAVAASVIA